MEKVFTGKTAEEAIAAGLAEMGLNREDAEIVVLDEGKKGGLFGIGAAPAQVSIKRVERLTDGERAVRFLEGLFERVGQDVVVTLTEEGERIVIELTTASAKSVIGRRGEFIDAVQILAGAVANTGRTDYKRVVVDCGNYREEREETLRRVAAKMAAKAVRLGKRVRLEPMNPYERRIIHAALVDDENVTTKSEGKEPARFVVIIPKNMRTFDRNRGGRGGKDRYRERRTNNNGYDRDGRKIYPKRELPKESTPQSSGTTLGRTQSGYKKGSFSGFFGTYLGNSRDENADGETTQEQKDE